MTTLNITAENTWTEAKLIDKEYFDLSIQGTFVATITVQRRRKDETVWRDVKTYTEADVPVEKISGRIRNAWYFRAGVKTGEYTSGTIELELI